MDPFVERHGPCTVVVRERSLPDGRPVLLFESSGTCNSSDFGVCLERIGQRRAFTPELLTILDIRHVQREADADGLFQQARIFARARVRRLVVAYISDTESTAAIAPMVRDVFGRAGVSAEIHMCRSLEDALDWMTALGPAGDSARDAR
ncbi:hypothetical protein [uncultured Rhodospira sp.]|uniref:hypothetical protein n=1 Tax=uncultured Rhodospira sp. TaxID=1936189 RepID=UPI00260A1D08|nr:hypothetical protein [uncultured Rhodospira sp.]